MVFAQIGSVERPITGLDIMGSVTTLTTAGVTSVARRKDAPVKEDTAQIGFLANCTITSGTIASLGANVTS